jgi:hypothetical protein
MKNLLLFLTFSLFVQINFIKADPWDCMSKEEAEELMDYLRDDPYVFDYCDCCADISDPNSEIPMGHLIKIEKMEIVQCSWDETQFSVKVVKSTVMISGSVKNGEFIEWPIYPEDEQRYAEPWMVTLNYTFTLEKGKKPVRLYKLINYKADEVNCSGIKEFPDPSKIFPENSAQRGYVRFLDRK